LEERTDCPLDLEMPKNAQKIAKMEEVKEDITR
jgi:hypothetical protein